MAVSHSCVGIGLVAAAAAITLRPADAQSIPSDPQPTCVFTPAAFASMFESGRVTLNGAVNPADSTVNLDPNGPCSFFQWGDQMYLWLTGPASGNSGRITLFSPTFYTVSRADSAGRRIFVRNVPGAPVEMRLRTVKPVGTLPLVRARSGHLIEVEPAAADDAAGPVVRLRNGRTVRLGRVRRTASGALQFFDSRGRQVQVRTAVLPRQARRPAVQMPDGTRVPIVAAAAAARDAVRARRFTLGGIPVHVDRNNDVIDVGPLGTDTEEGQASGAVLISQNLANPSKPGSLVYYLISANDAYAYHRSVQGQAVIKKATTITFPQSLQDLVPAQNYAASNGLPPIANPKALAIEIKSSWVEASTVPNPNDYIRIEANVPVFDTRHPDTWVMLPRRSRRTTLVMVGLHVVGSTLGHGEMVWASFEHFGNAPNVSYSYNSTAGLRTVPQNTAGTWLFTPSGSQGPFNVQSASWNEPTATAPAFISGKPIAFAPVLRLAPWGSALGAGSAAMNTNLVALNNSRIGQLAPGDVRRNYFQLGAVWTDAGGAPSPQFTPTNLAGTTQLANTTMETFVQGPTSGNGTSCFSCHNQPNISDPASVAVSHVYRVLTPVPPVPAAGGSARP